MLGLIFTRGNQGHDLHRINIFGGNFGSCNSQAIFVMKFVEVHFIKPRGLPLS